MVLIRQGSRFRVGRQESIDESQITTEDNDAARNRFIFTRSARLRNKHVSSRSLIVLVVLLTLVVAAIATLA